MGLAVEAAEMIRSLAGNDQIREIGGYQRKKFISFSF
jgi:hypothetical protein